MPTRLVPPSSPGSNGLKRHAALVPLSRDHHDVLVQARALRLSPSVETARGFLAYFEQQLRGHIQDEERTVLPRAEAARVEGVERIRAEHRELEALVSAIGERLQGGGDWAALLPEAGQLLDDHVRYEERAFFEAVQRTLTAAELDDLRAALEQERDARGGPSCSANLSAGRPDPSPIR